MAKILILEDDYEAARSWRAALAAAGHAVVLSYTSSEAIAHYEHEPFDVYIVDMRIEIEVANVKDSGIKLLGYLAKRMPKPELRKRVIGVSGLLIDNDDALARQSFHLFDVETFMPKPFEPDALVAQVTAALDLLGQGGSAPV